MKSLSALIVVHNEEKQLKKCLQTLKFANEIVVILDKCTDKSKSIAQKFSNKIFQGSWDIEGERRNFGIEKCSGDWILEIDADERIPKKLQKEILSITQNSRSDWHPINVENYFGERVVSTVGVVTLVNLHMQVYLKRIQKFGGYKEFIQKYF